MVETIGKIATDLQVKADMQTDSIELQREMLDGSNSEKSFEDEVRFTINRGLKDSEINGDFFVVVLTKKERLLKNVLRNYFFYRQSCPTPEFDQTVYHYHRKVDEAENLWTVPNNAACRFLPELSKDLPEDQMRLVYMVEAFNNGDLDRLCSKLNLKKESKILITP